MRPFAFLAELILLGQSAGVLCGGAVVSLPSTSSRRVRLTHQVDWATGHESGHECPNGARGHRGGSAALRLNSRRVRLTHPAAVPCSRMGPSIVMRCIKCTLPGLLTTCPSTSTISTLRYKNDPIILNIHNIKWLFLKNRFECFSLERLHSLPDCTHYRFPFRYCMHLLLNLSYKAK